MQDACWRVENEQGVICNSAADDNRPGSALYKGLHALLGQRVEAAQVENTGLDVRIQFGGGAQVLIFSAPLSEELNEDNYTVFTPTQAMTVGFDGSVEVSARDKQLH